MRKIRLNQMVSELGLTILTKRTKNHLVVRLRNQQGEIRQFAFSRTPSDVRTERNMRAELARFARGSYEKNRNNPR